MAALPLCASPPAAVAAASLSSRPFHGAMRVHLPDRRGPSPAPVKLQARTRESFRSHCKKRADGPHEPENYDPDKAATLQNHPLVEEQLNKLRAHVVRVPPNIFFKEKEQISDYRRKLSRSAHSRGATLQNHPLVEEQLNKLRAHGVRVPPNIFFKEKEQISDYRRKLSRSAHSWNLDDRVVAKRVCSSAHQALDLASKVMDIARNGPGTTEFSQHTTDQMVRTYATALHNVADDAYHMKTGIETTLSFLGAVRGFGAICHILVQDAVAKLKVGHLKNKITHHMDTLSQEFYKEMDNLEDEVARMKEEKLQEMVTRILMSGRRHAYSYIFELTDALDDLTSKE